MSRSLEQSDAAFELFLLPGWLVTELLVAHVEYFVEIFFGQVNLEEPEKSENKQNVEIGRSEILPL